MSRLLAACVVLAFALPASAADEKPKPNALTPKEIADGWVLLFNGETTFGWGTEQARDGKKPDISVKDGVLAISGQKSEVHFNALFQHFEFKGEYRTATKGSSLSIVIHQPGSRGVNGAGLAETKDEQWGSLTILNTQDMTVIKPDFNGAGGETRVTRGAPQRSKVQVGFGFPSDADARIELRNLKLRPLSTTPLFTGKNLDGWKINAADPKRMASKWEVTKDGELSLKNGPGDLFTEKQYDNFVLQLECKTLGKFLNSGVFFRCMPERYQDGYEAQIQNAFLGEDRTKPIDFGTGAIYRRVAARKVVSNDNEWFTMTVVADGKHIATWVNGYQTVDWTDDRPADDNPRKGYRAAKGHLSIQGHDPTTDLLFRNIRIAELGTEKK